MWTHSPGRIRMHRISTVLADPLLQNLAKNDIYWDKVVAVEETGYQEFVEFDDAQGYPVVVQGVLLQL
ncbi:hypothetical protein BH10ACT9_BH10ACT9_03500 [soil metagenome]